MRRAAALLLSRAAASASSCSSTSALRSGRRDAIGALVVDATTSTPSNLPSYAPRRSLAIPCNLKLGAAPPPPLVVRYAKGGADAFIELADELEESVPGLIVEGKEDEGESGGTITEVLAPGGQVLLSATQGKPVEAEDVLRALEKWQREQGASK